MSTLFFFFVSEAGFHHIHQVGLRLWDPPLCHSRARIKSRSHHQEIYTFCLKSCIFIYGIAVDLLEEGRNQDDSAEVRGVSSKCWWSHSKMKTWAMPVGDWPLRSGVFYTSHQTTSLLLATWSQFCIYSSSEWCSMYFWNLQNLFLLFKLS